MVAGGAIEGGTLIDGRYELDARLGEGAFGEVWRAHDRRLTGRFVAVKFLRLEHMERPDLVARFEAEAGALALLQHPGVVAVLDRGEWRGQRFLVTEFVEGVTLSAWLQRHRDARRPTDLETVRQLFDQVCAGVESAHAVRSPGAIVHRDIKPDNVIIREMTGGDLAAKVLDFGIAQLGGRSATRTGMLLGTPAYMAPEQAMGQTAGIQPYTDVFALGVLLAEMLTLNPHPRGEETWWAVSLREGNALRSLVAGLRGDVPPAVWSAVATALSSEGSARQPNAGALRAAIRGAWPASTSFPPNVAPQPQSGLARTVAMEMPVGPGFPVTPMPSVPPTPSFPPTQLVTQFSTQYAPTPSQHGAWTPTAGPPPPARPRTDRWSIVVPAVLAGCLVVALVVAVATKRRGPTTSDGDASVAAAEPTAALLAAPAMADAERIPVGASPSLGPADALVTIVEFSDFQCPFCSRVEGTLRQLRERYGNDVRVVWKNAPLPFHHDATPAAEAAMEAFAQGGNPRFWQMHDLLYENQRSLDRATLERLAGQVGLDIARFRAALDNHTHAAGIERDKALAAAVDAQGTPNFFINGTQVRGAQPLERFTAVIDQVLARARAIQPRERVYAQMVADPVPTADAPRAARPAAPSAAADENRVYDVRDNPGAPSFGPANARVVIQHFSDFQCPFCSRVDAVVRQIRERYGDRVRFVWRDYPLPFHENAMLAAEAAREAFAQQGDQGFWAFHDRLLANQSRLGRDDLEGYASEQGLDLRAFRSALRRHTHQPGVRADIEAVAAAGARIGTPAFFINGTLLTGAQPFEVFQRRIDAALAAAR